MAIGTNAAVKFYGTKVDLSAGTTPGAVAAAAFSAAADLDNFTNADDAPEAAITLEMEVDVAADDNSGCNMYFRALNVESTSDDEVPEAEYRHTFIGFFPALNGSTALQRSTIVVPLPSYKTSSVWEVYIENLTGQAITTSTWSVFVTPITIGPHA